MKKRGVEMSMNVIIIAAIALIILVILVLLVTNAGGDIVDNTGCVNGRPQGSCEELFDQSCADIRGEGFVSGGQLDCSQGAVCCYAPI